MNGCGKRSGKRSAVLVAGLLVVLGMFGTWVRSGRIVANPQVAPIGSRPYGQTYGAMECPVVAVRGTTAQP